MVRRTSLASLSLGILTLTFGGAARAQDAGPPAGNGPTAPATAPRAAAEPTPNAPAEPAPDEVSVTGKRLVETGGSVHAVRDAQLRRFSYDDPHQVLLGVPGVYVRPEDGLGLRPNIGMRGANSDRSKKVTLMEDGVLFGPAPYSAPAAYYFPLVDRVRTVKVYKGPAAIVFGPNTVGGAIDFVTREIPDSRKGTYDVAFGQYGFNKQHVTVGGSDEKLGFLIEGMRLDTTGFKELDRNPDANTGFTRNEWMVKGSWNPDPSAKIENELLLKLGYSDEVSNETYLGLTDADFRATPDRRYLASQLDRMKWHRTAVTLTHRVRFSRSLEMTTTAYRHDLSRIWRKVNGFRGADLPEVLGNPTGRNAVFRGVLSGDVDAATDAETILIGPNDRTYVSQGVQTQVRGEAKTGPVSHAFTYGVRAHYDEIVRKHTQDGFRMTGGQLVPDGRVTELTADNTGATHALALHATDAATLGRLTVTPGVRIEAIFARTEDRLRNRRDGATYQVVVPGVSAYYALTGELGVLAGAHRGFSPVLPEQVRSASPERSTNYEAGARWASRRLRAEAIGFFNDYQNLTNICTASNGCVGDNVDRQFDAGRARIAGVEVFAESEAKLGGGFVAPLRASYTYTYTEFLSTFSSADPQFGNVRRGDELPYVPPHQFAGAIGLERQNRYGINVAGTFVDAMRERAGQGTPGPSDLTDAYFLLDASVKYRFFSFLELYVNGRNLLDDRYIASRRPFGARPGAPRWLMAGVRGEF